MSESGLNDFGMLTLSDQQRCVSVAEVVDATWLADRASDSGFPDSASKVCLAQRLSTRGRENEIALARIGDEVLGERIQEEGWQSKRSQRGSGLRIGELKSSSRLSQSAFDPKLASEEINVLSSEAGKLAEAKTCICGREHKGSITAVDGVGQVKDFCSRQEPPDLLFVAGEVDFSSRGERDHACVYRGSQCRGKEHATQWE